MKKVLWRRRIVNLDWVRVGKGGQNRWVGKVRRGVGNRKVHNQKVGTSDKGGSHDDII